MVLIGGAREATHPHPRNSRQAKIVSCPKQEKTKLSNQIPLALLK